MLAHSEAYIETYNFESPLDETQSIRAILSGLSEFDEREERKTTDDDWFVSHADRDKHETFIREAMDVCLEKGLFQGTSKTNKVLEWKDPEELKKLIDFKPQATPASRQELLDTIERVIRYSVKTGHPYFINQLYSTVDPFGLVGQWVTDVLNPSVYTYEVSPVFTIMEEEVLREMRKIVGFPNDGKDGDGIFCPGGSMANGYAINCARHYFFPEIKKTGVHSCQRLIVFTSEDAHYSVEKLASFLGLGSDNVIKIRTDARGKMSCTDLEQKINETIAAGARPLMVSATAGTTVLGAFDPLDQIADVCRAYNMWLHVDAAWGGGLLMSAKYRALLKGIERADSVTWNPHKLLAAPQQCSTLLLRHKNVLAEANSAQATYLFQKDKFYDTSYDTGDKHIQCGRRADVFKFWFMWKAKGRDGFEKHIDRVMSNAEFFTEQIKLRTSFKMVVANPECTNVCFWYVPKRLQKRFVDPRVNTTADFNAELHQVAPRMKEMMMREGSMMVTYQPLKHLPNFFRLVLQSSALTRADMLLMIRKFEELGKNL